MARTHEYIVRMILKQDGDERSYPECKLGATSHSKEMIQIITLSTQTANYEVNFGSNFTTPTKLFLAEHAGYTFTFSVGANDRHHLVAANGCAFEHGSVSSLFLSNNATASTNEPEVEIVLVR